MSLWPNIRIFKKRKQNIMSVTFLHDPVWYWILMFYILCLFLSLHCCKISYNCYVVIEILVYNYLFIHLFTHLCVSMHVPLLLLFFFYFLFFCHLISLSVIFLFYCLFIIYFLNCFKTRSSLLSSSSSSLLCW